MIRLTHCACIFRSAFVITSYSIHYTKLYDVLVIVMWTGMPATDDGAGADMASDMEILLTEDSLEMLEDLEFYSWIDLDEEMEAPPQPDNHVG